MIGALRHPLTLQEAVETPDGGGGFTTAWRNLPASPQVYAAIMPLSGQESLHFRKVAAETTHRIKLRYRGDVTTSMRMVDGDNKIYEILSVIDIDKSGAYLDILAVVRA